MDLIDFAEEYRESSDFRHLAAPFTHYVPGRGSERPRIMLLGEAPSALENLERRPFVGAPGRALAGLMELAGIYAEDHPPEDDGQSPSMDVGILANAYVTLTVKYKTPGLRTPTGSEIAASRKWVSKEWNILGKPPVIVAVGQVALACIAPQLLPLRRCVGRPVETEEGIKVWPMYQPAYALRNPTIRPKCEEHWELLGSWLNEKGLL